MHLDPGVLELDFGGVARTSQLISALTWFTRFHILLFMVVTFSSAV